MGITTKLRSASDFQIAPPTGYTIPYISTDGTLHRITDTLQSVPVSMPLYEQIPQNQDLNTYTNVGYYRCSATGSVATLSNCPADIAFSLRVTRYADSAYMQELQTANWIYHRYRNNDGQWSPWYCIQQAPVTPIFVGPTRQIQTIAQLNSYLDGHALHSRYLRIHFDSGTYTGNLTIDRGFVDIQKTNQSDSVTIDGHFISRYADVVQIIGFNITGRVEIQYVGRLILTNCNALRLHTLCTDFLNINNCTFAGEAGNPTIYVVIAQSVDIQNCTSNNVSTAALEHNQISYCQYVHLKNDIFDATPATTGGTPLKITACNANVNSCTLKNAFYGIFAPASHIDVLGTPTYQNISGYQMIAYDGGLIKAFGVTSVTRNNVTGAYSSPAQGTVGNYGSYVYYGSTYTA